MVKVVSPKDIRSALHEIWDTFKETNKMRACLFNLIIYAKKNQRGEYLNALVEKMIQKFPSRIVFISIDPESSGKIETSVDVLTADTGKQQIMCDLINIDVSHDKKDKIPFLMLPHILPDLPVYMVHAADPCENDPTGISLETYATRVIYDSEASNSLPQFAKAVLEHHKAKKCQIADLSWGRIEGWRQLFIDTLSPEELKEIQEITITYNDIESETYRHPKIQSTFIQAWLATQLGWKLKGCTKEGFEYEGVKVNLVPGKLEGLYSGRIIDLTITIGNGSSITFVRMKNPLHHIRIEKSTQDACMMPTTYIFDQNAIGLSLVREICHSNTSSHFLKLMQFLRDTEGTSCEIH